MSSRKKVQDVSRVARKAVVLACALFFGACELLGPSAEEQVAEDARAQYQAVARAGDDVAKCAHAGIVAAAYLQAGNEAAYREWAAREREDCARAGAR